MSQKQKSSIRRALGMKWSDRACRLPRKRSLTVEPLENRTLLSGLSPVSGGFLQGTVFVDKNDNGVFDAGDLPVAGATVELYKAGTLVATTTAGANGQYQLRA